MEAGGGGGECAGQFFCDPHLFKGASSIEMYLSSLVVLVMLHWWSTVVCAGAGAWTLNASHRANGFFFPDTVVIGVFTTVEVCYFSVCHPFVCGDLLVDFVL